MGMTDAPPRRSAAQVRIRLIRRGLLLLAVIASLSVLAGFLGALHPLLDLFSHFQVHLLLGCAFLLTLSVIARARASALLMLVACLVTGAGVAPYRPSHALGSVMGGERLRVMSVNALATNTNHQALLDEVRRADPDVLVVIEVAEHWERALGSLRDVYPYSSMARSMEHPHLGVEVFSKLALRDIPFPPELRGSGFRGLILDVETPTVTIRLIAAHPDPPISIRASRNRDRFLRLLNQVVRDSDSGPVLVVGDLNTTPWGHGYRLLTRGTSLRNARLGFGVRGTWHARLPALLRVPIDHVLANKSFGVISFETGADIGSDHLPVIASLILRKP